MAADPHWARRGMTVALAAALAACGGGDTPSAARKSALAVSAASAELPVVLTDEADPLFQGLAIPADAPTRGMWSATQPWPMNGLHAVLMPDGRVLT